MGLIITLGIVGVQGLVGVVVDVRQSRQDPDPHWSSTCSLLHFGLPFAAYLLCLWIAQALARGDVDALDWLPAVVFSLLFSTSSNCWEVLKAVGNPDAGQMHPLSVGIAKHSYSAAHRPSRLPSF